MSVDVKYRTKATATGGREGHSATQDGAVDIKLVTPKELGGGGGDGVNPEQLFATGYAACFLGALKAVAGKDKIKVPSDATVQAEVGIGPRSDGEGFGLEVALTVTLPGVEADVVDDLMTRAHVVCPYSHATRNNIKVDLKRG